MFFTMSSHTSVYNCRNILEDQILCYVKIITTVHLFSTFSMGFQAEFSMTVKKNPYTISYHSHFRNLNNVGILKEKNNVYLYHDYVIQHLFLLVLNLQPLKG